MTANRMGTALECAHSALGHRQGVSGALADRRSETRLKSVEPGVEPTRIQNNDMRDTISGRGDRKEEGMNWYKQLIKEATGRSDLGHLQAIEDEMRVEHGTLDGLTRSRFIKSARISEEVCVQLGDIPA